MNLYYSHNLNPRVAVAVARHLRAPVEYIRASPRDPAQREAFRKINPNTLVPILVEADRTYWETDAIACRLSALAGSDFWRTCDATAEMIMWISWAKSHFIPAGEPAIWYRITLPSFSDEPPDLNAIETGLADFRENAAILDSTLKDKEWLVGGTLSYADFRVASTLPFAGRAGLPLDDYPNIKRWHDQLWAIDAWRDPFAGLEASSSKQV